MKYLHLKTEGFSNAIDFPNRFHVNWVRCILRRVHDQFLWLEAKALIKITKDVIQRVIGFSAISEALTLRTISSTKVTRLTQSRCDRKEMTIAHIEDAEVRFASTVLGYRVYQSSHMNSVPSSAMHVAYRIIKEDATYDICEMIRSLRRTRNSHSSMAHYWYVYSSMCKIAFSVRAMLCGLRINLSWFR